MESNELRGGNLISVNNEIKPVSSFEISVLNYDSELITPIALNEAWLLRLGFYKKLDNGWFQGYIYCNPKAKPLNWVVKYWHDEHPRHAEKLHTFRWDKIELKTVHQLQNLYYALTGHELETT